jgi:hypothetical protein
MRGLFVLALAAWAGAQDLPRPKWLENGLIDAGGSHEPYIFVVRRGGQSRNARQQYEQQQSEALLKKLKDQGIEVFHTHLYKGFGMKAEMPEMEDAKRVAAMAHSMGLKVDSYIQWNTLMYETFFAEEPRAKDWVQRDESGKPIMLLYGYQQSFRYRPCFANQEYLDYLKKIVRYAVEEVKTDFIHFDNFDLNPEPDSCHDGTCVRGFREFLKKKYTPAQRKERFGFENVDFVNPPSWNKQNPPEKMEIIFDPAIQEWVDYRCQVMSDALRQMSAYAKSLNPEVAIEVNPHGITGENRAWDAGLDHTRFLKWTDVFWTEEENVPGYVADGRLVSKIRSYKLARTFNNILLTYISDSPLAMAECLAFNQTIGFAGVDPIPPDMLKYTAFYRKHRDLFVGAKDAGNVAVFRSYPSITYHNARTQLSAVLTEQALIQAKIPFDLIFDEHLKDLSKYKTVILPDSECLSDAQVAAIRKYVEGGGGVVALERTGLYDEWRRLRTEPALRGLVDTQNPAADYEETVGAPPPAGTPSRKEVGSGRVVYIPEMVFDGQMPERAPNFAIDNRYWKRPRNWEELAAGVRWASKGSVPVMIEGPEYLVANLVAQPEKHRVLVHLVNYGVATAPSISAKVSFRLPQGQTAKQVQMISPDTDKPMILATDASSQAGTVTFSAPVKTYSIAVVSW